MRARREFLKLAGAGVTGAMTMAAPAAMGAVDANREQKITGGRPAKHASLFEVRAFGATGDGTTIDTPAIQRAIDAAESSGGGTVYFAAGQYLCYSIRLKSNVALHLDQGAVIVAADALPQGKAGGWFGILATGVDNLTIDGLTIDTNRDGMDIDCCRNVRIANCAVNSPWDDAIVPKSSYALGYARATENLEITNCFVTGAYVEGTMLDGSWRKFDPSEKVPHTGRIKLGTESNGGFKNITISNCVFEGCQGLALESVDGALLEDVVITNITMRDIVSAPIFMRLGSRLRGPAESTKTGTLQRVMLSNIVCSNAASNLGCILSGVAGHEIQDVKLHHIYIQHRGGGTKEQAAIAPAEDEQKYPEPNMFGDMPSQGFYLRHVKNIEISNVEIATMAEDVRPAFVLEAVDGADFFHVKTPPNAPVIELRHSKAVNALWVRGVKDGMIGGEAG
jgi:polygalacturonase